MLDVSWCRYDHTEGTEDLRPCEAFASVKTASACFVLAGVVSLYATSHFNLDQTVSLVILSVSFPTFLCSIACDSEEKHPNPFKGF